jgi:peptide-methionine (R)-S-oxide reductase
MKILSLVLTTILLSVCFTACSQKATVVENLEKTYFKVNKSDSEWRELLTPEQYRVLREKGTERAFTGEFNKHNEEGTYTCAACNNPLFASSTKYDSGSGWPSFFAPIGKENVKEYTDRSHGMIRTEVVCANCGGHLGHVFPDGPRPTGMRYCINSISMGFEKKSD